MGDDADRESRRTQEGTAVSSGDSSIAVPKPALDSDAMTSLGVPVPPDVTLAEPASPSPVKPVPSPVPAKRDSSNDATIVPAQKARESSSGTPSPIYAAIGATVL